MAGLDRCAYIVRNRCPWVFSIAELSGDLITRLLYGRRIAQARCRGSITGTVDGVPAIIRSIYEADASDLLSMLDCMPEDHLKFFHPHKLDGPSVRRILRKKTVMTYGLFVNDKCRAYALLKLFPTKKAYIGRLVSPDMTGLGIGKFLSRYLYWQTKLLGFKPCSTIHEENLASLKSHAAVRPFTVLAKLPNRFQLISFNHLPEDDEAPELDVTRKPAPK